MTQTKKDEREDRMRSRDGADGMDEAERDETNEEEDIQRGEGAPDLTGAENREVLKRTAPRAAVVFETIRREGEDELARPTIALAWSGLAAGLSMGFSLVAEGLLRTYLPDAPWSHLIAAFGYSIGFLIVILGRQQLFTENTLTPILPVLSSGRTVHWWNVARLWAVVLAANLLGALLFAWAIGTTDVFDAGTHRYFAEVGRDALRSGFWTTMLRGVFAGWLIALMVWLLPFAETARVGVIIIITYIVGVARLAHSIAGSVDVLYLVVTDSATWQQYLFGFLAPALSGNILGGVALVALLNYAQVVSGNNDEQDG